MKGGREEGVCMFECVKDLLMQVCVRVCGVQAHHSPM